MATRYFCDACGREVPDQTNLINRTEVAPEKNFPPGTKFDLCGVCNNIVAWEVIKVLHSLQDMNKLPRTKGNS